MDIYLVMTPGMNMEASSSLGKCHSERPSASNFQDDMAKTSDPSAENVFFKSWKLEAAVRRSRFSVVFLQVTAKTTKR